jgi:membrane protease YdiL (CAAX protease family)
MVEIADRHKKNFIYRNPLRAYFVFSYVFFWLFLTLVVVTLNFFHLNTESLPIWLMPLVTVIGSWMPTFAALIVTSTIKGPAGIGNLFRKFIQYKVSIKWYLAALIPFGLGFAAVWIYHFAGKGMLTETSHSLNFWIGLVVVNLLAGPTGEELGWRGFALPRLLEKYTPLKAGIILGIIWDVWHLPLWFTSGFTSTNLLLYCLYFSISIISLSILMTWIFCNTSSSLVPMALSHFSFNIGQNLFGPQGLGLVPTLPLLGITSIFCLLSIIIIGVMGGFSKNSNKAEIL